jgi:uncharacterized membrane protein
MKGMEKDLPIRILKSFSATGLLLGTVFFAFSLTPSLVPRPFLLQALVSGVALTSGYALGVILRWLWDYLQLPVPASRIRLWIKLGMAVLFVGVAIGFLVQASKWQNSVRMLMEMEPVEGTRPFSVGVIALLVFLGLLFAGRLFLWIKWMMARKFHRVVPQRIAWLAGLATTVFLFWTLINGVLASWMLNSFDASFRQLDTLIEAELDPPTNPARTGSAQSLLAWDELGRQGRRHIARGPTRDDLEAFGLDGAMDPIRIYVGLNSAETIEERTELALAEMQRVGAFERSILVIATPTGTGWVDPGGINSLEYLHRGDVASVAVQYSYLPSWLSLLAQADYGSETARSVFQAIYHHWRQLPSDSRPRLYLFGLSLGALNSERSADVWDLVGDPIHGALWSGPPFRSETWQWVTAQRDHGSPAWLPVFRDGAVFRFTNQHDPLADHGADWGSFRIVYLQYASDPITFFEPSSLYREPQWMRSPRGPDVSPSLRWFPVVTTLQLAADIAAAEVAPIGYGHAYATEHYIDAWHALTEPDGWDALEIQRLKAEIGDLN